MMSAPKMRPLTVVPRDEVLHLGGVHISPGIYEAAGGKLTIERKWSTWKAIVRWTVLVPDPDLPDGHRRVIIRQFYNLDRHKRPRPCSDLARALILITGTRRIDRSRLPRAFLGVFARVQVVDVPRDQHGRVLGPATYSRVSALVEVIAGRGHAFSLDHNRRRLGLRKDPPLRCATSPPSSPSGTDALSPSETGTCTNPPVPEQEGNV